MARSRFFASTSLTTRSPMRITTSVASSSPATMRRTVVFPHPDGPTSTMRLPSGISRSSLRTASVPSGNTFETCSSSIAAIGRGDRSAAGRRSRPPHLRALLGGQKGLEERHSLGESLVDREEHVLVLDRDGAVVPDGAQGADHVAPGALAVPVADGAERPGAVEHPVERLGVEDAVYPH